MRSTCRQAVSNSVARSLPMRVSKAARMSSLVLPLHRDDEGKAEALDIGGVEVGEAVALRVGQRVEAGGGLLAGRFRRQALGRRQLAGEVGMGVEHAEALGLAGRAEDARQRVVQPAGRVVRGAEFQRR